MEKQIERVSNTIGTIVFCITFSLFIGSWYLAITALYHVLQIDNENARVVIAVFSSVVPMLLLSFLFVSVGEFVYESILQTILKRKIPAPYTYETLQESVFLEAKLLIERSNEEMNLQNIVDKIKQRNTDVKQAVLSSLYRQYEKDIDCPICKQKIEIKCGTIISPCACKSIKNYEKS